MDDQIEALVARFTCPLPDHATADDARSARFAAVEVALRLGLAPAEENARIIGWVQRALDLSDFTARHGRFPRENNRAPAGMISLRESSLHEWVRLQRRSTSCDNHCTYQTLRLELIPGFQWDPHGEAWENRLTEYRTFVADHRRAPRARSSDPLEKALAHWAAKQRSQHRLGRLSRTRASGLQSLPLWTW